MRLDSAEFAFRPLENDDGKERHALVPGDRRHSLAWQRVNSDDEEELMPPPDRGAALTAEENVNAGLKPVRERGRDKTGTRLRKDACIWIWPNGRGCAGKC